MTFRMTKLPIDGFDGDLEEQETGDEAIGVEWGMFHWYGVLYE